MTTPTIICAGLITLDTLYFLPDYPVEGEKHRAADAIWRVGGGALLAASTIAALGGHALLAGTIGDDLQGEFIRQDLARRGIDDSLLISLPNVATSHSAVLITANGERTIVNARDPRLFETAPRALPDFDAVLTDTRWPNGARILLEAARADGLPAVVDAEVPFAEFQNCLGLASHVAFSAQGLTEYAGAPDAIALKAAQNQLDVWTCVTRGAAPVLCHDGRELTEIATFPTRAVDTLGAGDAWHGAFVYSLARGELTQEAVRFANAVASVKVRHRNHLPSLDEVHTILR